MKDIFNKNITVGETIYLDPEELFKGNYVAIPKSEEKELDEEKLEIYAVDPKTKTIFVK